MKKIVKQLFFLSLLVALFASCKKDENKVFFEGGTNPVLSASVTSGTLPLSYANKDKEAIRLSWTNPNFQFNTGISSQDVNYQIEIDTTGANFTNPNRQTVSVSKDLSISFTQGQFNDYLLNQLQLTPGVSHNIEIRVTASLTAKATAIVSNVLKYAVTPYAIPPKVSPPPSGHLYLVGDATSGGWNNPVPVPAQEFTQVSITLYKITVPLIGGKQFLFLPVNGDWSNKYACESTSAQPVTGGDFGYNGGNNTYNANFPGPLSSGTYTITVDFQRGKYTITQ